MKLFKAITIAVATAGGILVGLRLGQPAIGGMVGTQVGQCVNEFFAAGNTKSRIQLPDTKDVDLHQCLYLVKFTKNELGKPVVHSLQKVKSTKA